MARFRATIKGQRGSASRLGGPGSGIQADVNGWDSGVRVEGMANGSSGDIFRVVMTGGSNKGSSPTLLGTVVLVDGEPEFVRPA